MSSFSFFFFFYHLFIARENLDKTRRVFVISLSFFRKIKIWNIENIRGNIVSWIFEGRKRGWFGLKLQLSISRDVYRWSNREIHCSRRSWQGPLRRPWNWRDSLEVGVSGNCSKPICFRYSNCGWLIKEKKKKRRRGNLGFQWRLSSMHMPLNAYTRIHRYILYDRNLRYHRHHRFLTSVIYTLLWRRQRPDIFIRKGVPSIITAPTPHFYAFMHFVIQRAMPALFIREFRKYIFALKLLPRLLINKRKNGKGLKDSFNKLFIGLSS